MTADGATNRVTRFNVKDVFLFNMPLGEIEVHVFPGRRKLPMNLLGAKSLNRVSISINTSAQKAEIRRVD